MALNVTQPKLSIVVSTYNSEPWLEKVLWGFNCQTFRDFELVVADDGSGSATRELLERMTREVFYPLIHVWQEDEGFQKSRILNKATMACNAEYIIMTDGDCIPREDFAEVHYINKKEGYFISGGYYMLPLNISQVITREDIEAQRCFDIQWLKDKGIPKTFKNNKITANGVVAFLLNRFTPTRATWNGHNSSGWKRDILNVNGFDERMQYGGQDRELGERLVNTGIKPRQLRYSAVCVHLHHQRTYKTKESLAKNREILKVTRQDGRRWTDYGITK